MINHFLKLYLFKIRLTISFILTIAVIPAFSAEICDINEDGLVNDADISLIFQARGTSATDSFDARDIDRDGLVTVKDGRWCVCMWTTCGAGPSPKNNEPVTNAGPDQVADSTSNGYQTVVLDGSASQDPDGDALSYQWVIQSRPSGSQALLSNATDAIASFTPDLPGRYVAALTATDGFGSSHTQSVNIDSSNTAPIADAGTGATFLRAANTPFDTVTLNGSGSSDVDGNALNYSWSLVSVPAGSQAVLNDPNAVMPSFTPDQDGDYEVQLIVNDGQANSATDTVVIKAETQPPENTPPVAHAGSEQNIVGNEDESFDAVALDGSQSSDKEGDNLTYSWSFVDVPENSQAVLNDPSAVMPSFIPDLEGDYEVQLIVNDGQADSMPVTVVIRIARLVPQNTRPEANAGSDQTIFRNESEQFNAVVLDGSQSSDINGDKLSYRWSFIAVPEASQVILNDPNTVMPSFIPDLNGRYEIQLFVSDGRENSSPDTVIISTGNTAPVANTGPDQGIFRNESGQFNVVALEGSQSTDVDGDELSYRWSFVSVPEVSHVVLNAPNTVMPGFTPDLDGRYELQLIVSDGQDNSSPDTVVISTENTAPVAVAGPDQIIFRDENEKGQFKPVVLEGDQSSDVDGDELSYRWSLVSVPTGSQAILNQPNSVMPGFTPDVEGNYIAQLIVNDGLLDSAADTMVITMGNSRPIARAGSDQTVLRNETGVFDPHVLEGGQSTDIDGDLLGYNWSITSKPVGSEAQLSNPTSVMPAFTPDVDGEYVIQLIVNDGEINSVPDTVLITTGNTRPIANAGPNRQIPRNPLNNFGLVTLDGSGSTDVDGDKLSFTWSAISTPDGNQVTLSALSDPNSVRPSFTPHPVLAGDYVWQLIVNDGKLDSAPDTVVISTDAQKRSIAKAGVDLRISRIEGKFNTITFDGGQSTSSSESSPLSYRWSLISRPDGSNAALIDAETQTPSLTPDVKGIYVVQLIVNDTIVESEPDTVTLTADNAIPVAEAGSDQSRVGLGATVTLDGSQSFDADNDSLGYQWALTKRPDGSVAALNDPNIVNPDFTLDIEGEYLAQLIVNDGISDSEPDTVSITSNQSSIANAGDDQVVLVDFIRKIVEFNGDTTPIFVFSGQVTLDGSKSVDPDDDPLTYEWKLVKGPSTDVQFMSDNDSAARRVVSLPRAGTYVFGLNVNDGKSTSRPDTVTITTNFRPVADAGEDDERSVPTFTDVIIGFNGSGSSDEDNDSLTYQWTIDSVPNGNNAILVNSKTISPSLSIPGDSTGSKVFQIKLIVTDEKGIKSLSDTVSVRVRLQYDV